jgi:hypothetical protein
MAFATPSNTEGYLDIKRVWKKGDQIALRLKLEPRLVVGDHGNLGKVALLYGPLVLAADEALLGNGDPAQKEKAATLPLNAIAVAGPKLAMLKVTPEPAPAAVKSWSGAQVFRARAVTRRPVGSLKIGTPRTIRLIPFADAGGTGTRYKVWLPLPSNLYSGNLLLEGQESRSRRGNLGGSIVDEDFQTTVTTWSGKTAEEDWFAVQLDEPITVKRVLFAHGKTFHDGGWFDATAGKPRVQVKRAKDGAWETVAEFKDYPATTAKNSAEMDGGESFNCTLAEPLKVWGIRVAGKPACGDNPQQSFSSCAELQAFSE